MQRKEHGRGRFSCFSVAEQCAGGLWSHQIGWSQLHTAFMEEPTKPVISKSGMQSMINLEATVWQPFAVRLCWIFQLSSCKLTFCIFRRVGEHITSTTSDGRHQDIDVEKIIYHPNYQRNTIDSDIALMKLATPVKFDKYVKPVCLPQQGANVPIGTQCYITGEYS